MFHKTSSIELKDVTGSGEVAGVAWSFLDAPDRQGDHIIPAAFSRHSGDIPIKVEHKGDPVGSWHGFDLDDEAFRVEGHIDRTSKQGKEAIARARDGDLRSLSIGFAGQYQKSGRSRIFTELELSEISLVKQPANAGARVTTVKTLAQCERISDLQKALQHGLGMTGSKARIAAQTLWPMFNEHDEAEELLGILNQFSMRF